MLWKNLHVDRNPGMFLPLSVRNISTILEQIFKLYYTGGAHHMSKLSQNYSFSYFPTSSMTILLTIYIYLLENNAEVHTKKISYMSPDSKIPTI